MSAVVTSFAYTVPLMSPLLTPSKLNAKRTGRALDGPRGDLPVLVHMRRAAERNEQLPERPQAPVLHFTISNGTLE